MRDLPQYQGARQQMKRGMLAVQAYERQLTKALIEGAPRHAGRDDRRYQRQRAL